MATPVGINSLQTQMQAMVEQSKGSNKTQSQSSVGFGHFLEKALEHVNQQQSTVQDMQQRFELGDKSVSLSQVMLETQKSNLEFQALLQVRNKALRAYQDVMNLPW